MQGMVQRSQDVTTLKTQEDGKANLDQSNLFSNHMKELQHKQENVIKKEDVEYHQEKYDAKEKSKNEYEKDRQKKKNKKSKEEKDDGVVAIKEKKSFDVSI